MTTTSSLCEVLPVSLVDAARRLSDLVFAECLEAVSKLDVKPEF
jgi:hypothetical protein